jgi:hypothetical protein
VMASYSSSPLLIYSNAARSKVSNICIRDFPASSEASNDDNVIGSYSKCRMSSDLRAEARVLQLPLAAYLYQARNVLMSRCAVSQRHSILTLYLWRFVLNVHLCESTMDHISSRVEDPSVTQDTVDEYISDPSKSSSLPHMCRSKI